MDKRICLLRPPRFFCTYTKTFHCITPGLGSWGLTLPLCLTFTFRFFFVALFSTFFWSLLSPFSRSGRAIIESICSQSICHNILICLSLQVCFFTLELKYPFAKMTAVQSERYLDEGHPISSKRKLVIACNIVSYKNDCRDYFLRNSKNNPDDDM